MRYSMRYFARFLEPGSPTGLTGLFTHASPRSTLLSLYNMTLVNLKMIPETSLYRQSVEALTRHRMALVEATTPDLSPTTTPQPASTSKNNTRLSPQDGDHEIILACWSKENGWELKPITELSADGGMKVARPFATLAPSYGSSDSKAHWEWVGKEFINPKHFDKLKEMVEQEYQNPAHDSKGRLLLGVPGDAEKSNTSPQLTADQILSLEAKIGSGLLEEVIQTAEDELKLIEVIRMSQAWQDLEEQPVPGQWIYFERGS